MPPPAHDYRINRKNFLDILFNKKIIKFITYMYLSVLYFVV